MHKYHQIDVYTYQCDAVQEFPQDPVKGGAYNRLEYLMKKLKGDCFIGHDTSILLYKYLWIYKYLL